MYRPPHRFCQCDFDEHFVEKRIGGNVDVFMKLSEEYVCSRLQFSLPLCFALSKLRGSHVFPPISLYARATYV
jgi:hypothetical protein